MTDQNGAHPRKTGSFLVPLLALGMVVVIFGAIVGISSVQLRKELRGKILQRYADNWAPISQFHVAQGMEDELLGILEFEDTVVYSLLSAQDIEGALGAHVFDASGRFMDGIPYIVEESPLEASDIENLKKELPWGRYLTAARGDEISELELNVPIFDIGGEEMVAMVRYIFDGQPVEEEFGEVDQKLFSQASLAFATGTLLVSAVFLWSFWRLRGAHDEVAERAAHLAQANAELAMVAKTSAVGAVASHLVHGLKNPLAGVKEHLSSDGSDIDGEEWNDARQATARMQALINEVVDVLKNETIDEMESLSGEDIARYLRAKFEPRAQEKELDLGFRASSDVLLSARDANIAKLIVSNLVDNAIDAVSIGGEVETRIDAEIDEVAFTIIDTGPGFSQSARKNLFTPVQSDKTAGAGIALAISKQLARHLGANLELTRSSSSGSEIKLTVPLAQEWRAVN